MLVEKEELAVAIKNYDKNIDILTLGNILPNPSEMLVSEVVENLFIDLREQYDHILLDSPPINLVSDSQVLSIKADGTLLVVRAEKTKRESIKMAKEKIERVNGKIIGSMLQVQKMKSITIIMVMINKKL